MAGRAKDHCDPTRQATIAVGCIVGMALQGVAPGMTRQQVDDIAERVGTHFVSRLPAGSPSDADLRRAMAAALRVLAGEIEGV